MARRGRCVWMIATLFLCGSGAAQTYVPPPPPLTVDPCMATANPLLPKDPAAKAPPPCPPPAPKPVTPSAPTAGDQFPFPDDAPAAAKPSAAEQFPYPGGAPSSPTPAANKAAGQFPYPGETSQSPDAVPEGNTPRYVPDAPASGATPPTQDGGGSSSNSSSSSSSSSASGADPDGNAATGDADAPRRLAGRRALPKVSALSPDERVTQDLDVAKFYSDRGNFQAAYLRAKDAIRLMPDDPESHFVLAQAAQRLKRPDEAAAEYALYLKLDPSGSKTAEARRALSQLP